VWLEASYMPMVGPDQQVNSVIKVASDITERINKEHENQSIMNAIGRSMAVIEFTPHGQIINANQNFLNTMQYSLSEIVGQHHSMFCHRTEADSPSYKAFWASLNRGEFHSHRFERRNKHGQTLFLEASYNPIFDANGRLYKVVKFASDITHQVTTLRTAADSAHATSVQNDACARKGSEVVQQTVQIIEEISKRPESGGAEHRRGEQAVGQHRHHRADHPRHCRPNQPAGAQRGHRSRDARASTGAGLRWWPTRSAAWRRAPVPGDDGDCRRGAPQPRLVPERGHPACSRA
jgi:PAS domain S-box-containing protein